MKKLVFLLLAMALLLKTPAAYAQQLIPAGAPLADVDYKHLSIIDTLINSYIDKGWIHGVVTLIVKDGHIIQYKGYGYADLESKRVMRNNDLFRLASQTKAVVSTGIMILYEEGKLYLDEPVSDFIPSFRNAKVLDTFNAADSSYTTVPAKRDITFRDLLTHSSGLDYADIGSPSMRAIYHKAGITSGLGEVDNDLKERMAALGRLPLVAQPGEKWTYSLSIDVLGALIEIISGESLEQFLTARIFKPLGMNDTYFNVPASKAGRLTSVYREDSLHHVVKWTKAATGIDPDYPLAKKRYFSGGAGLTATAYDYAIFLQMMLNKGIYHGVRILSPRTVEMMTSGQLNFLYNGYDNFGLGFGITGSLSAARGPRMEGAFSWGGYFGTTYWADPKAKVIGLFMTQENPNSHGDLEGKFEQILYSSLR